MDNAIFFIGLDDTDHIDLGCTTENFNDFLNYLAEKINFSIKFLILIKATAIYY